MPGARRHARAQRIGARAWQAAGALHTTASARALRAAGRLKVGVPAALAEALLGEPTEPLLHCNGVSLSVLRHAVHWTEVNQ